MASNLVLLRVIWIHDWAITCNLFWLSLLINWSVGMLIARVVPRIVLCSMLIELLHVICFGSVCSASLGGGGSTTICCSKAANALACKLLWIHCTINRWKVLENISCTTGNSIDSNFIQFLNIECRLFRNQTVEVTPGLTNQPSNQY